MKIAVVIPVHPPRFKYVPMLVNSYLKNMKYIDLYFVMTSEDEQKLLQEYPVNFIILPKDIDHDRLEESRGYPTFKKFYALNQIKDDYDYAITMDVETEFLDLKNLDTVVCNFCEKKEVYGCNHNGKFKKRNKKPEKINNKCAEFLDVQVDNQNVFFWFSQIPIYHMKIFSKFIDHIDFENHNKIIDKLSWYTSFEYIIFMYYCVKYHGYKIVDLEQYNLCFNWSLEDNLNEDCRNRLKEHNIEVNWQVLGMPIFEETLIIYQIDRYRE